MNTIDSAMNKIVTLKLLPAITLLLAIGVFGSAHAKSKTCDTSNNIQGWGIWCGVESYVTQITAKNPTAAGSLPASPTQLKLEPTIDPNWLRQPDPTIGGEPNPVSPDTPDLVIDLSDTSDSDQLIGYTRTATHKKPGTSTYQLGSLTLKLETGGTIVTGGRIQMTRYNHAGQVEAIIDLSGNDPLFGPPSNPRRSTQVTTNSNPEKQGHASAIQTDRGTGYYKEERFTANEATLTNSGQSSNAKILKAYWIGTHSLYLASNNTISDINTHFIAGRLTPLSDIETLAAGNVTATYTGKSAFWRWDVNIDVDFKNKTFDGSWGNYGASGVLKGQHIISNAITGADSGIVQASFFNPNAEALGGAAEFTTGEITKADIFSTAMQPQ